MTTWGRLPREPDRLPRETGAAYGLWRIVEKAQDVLARYERLSALAEDDQVKNLMDRLAEEKRAQVDFLRGCLGPRCSGSTRESKSSTDGGLAFAQEAPRLDPVAIGRDCAYRLVVWAETRLWIVCYETALFGYNRRSREIAVNLAKDQKRVIEMAGRLARHMGIDEAVLDPSGLHDGAVPEAPVRETDTVNQQPGPHESLCSHQEGMPLAPFAPALQAGEKPADDSEERPIA